MVSFTVKSETWENVWRGKSILRDFRRKFADIFEPNARISWDTRIDTFGAKRV